MDKQHRHDLKRDVFQEEVVHSLDWLGEHRQLATRIGIGVVAAAVIGGGIWYYLGQQQFARQEELYKALRIYNAEVTSENRPGILTYKDPAQKDKDVRKALGDVIAKSAGSFEGLSAKYYLASQELNQGKAAEAEKLLRDVTGAGDRNLRSLGKLALGQLLMGSGKRAEGEKLLRELMDNPSALVSKEQATIALAEGIARENAAEARKLLEPLRGSDRGAVSRSALTLLGQLTAQGQ